MNYSMIINTLTKTILRQDNLKIIYTGTLISFDLSGVHRGLRPLLPYLFGYEELEGRDTMVTYLINNQYHVYLDGRKRNIEDLGTNEICIDFSKSSHKNYGKKQYQSSFNSPDEIVVKLLEYLFISFISSYQLSTSTFDPHLISKNHKTVEGREYSVSFGPDYCCNLLMPDKCQNLVELEININESKIKITSEKPYSLKSALIRRLKLKKSEIIINDNYLTIEMDLYKLVEAFASERINYLGIVHVNNEGKAALSETYYENEGSYGYCTAGGYNANPYFPEYGSLIESYGEFNILYKSIKKIILIKDFSQSYCTTISYYSNNSGDLKASPSEFREDSHIWCDAEEIRGQKIPLRKVNRSLKDYYKYEAAVIETLFINKLKNNNLSIEIPYSVIASINTDEIDVDIPTHEFGVIKINTNKELFPKIEEFLIQAEIDYFISKQLYTMVIKNLTPLKFKNKMEEHYSLA